MTVARHSWPLATPAIFLIAACLLSGCESRSGELQDGSYRAVLDLPDGQLPFGLVVEGAGDDRVVLLLVNGDERRRVDQVTAADGQLNATLSGAGSTLSARVVGPRLDGEVRLVRPDGGREQLLFRAVLGQSWRFFENPSTDNADIAGRWAVSYVGEKGAQATSTVVFRQSFERVTGSFGSVAGAGGLLAGEMRGDELHLSRFDGETAILLRARVAADGTMTGEYWALGTGHRRFRAVRGPDS